LWIDLSDDRNTECGSLAGTGLCLGGYVTPGLYERNGEGLDRRGLFEAHIFNGFSEFL
jgi:hypothetical protein